MSTSTRRWRATALGCALLALGLAQPVRTQTNPATFGPPQQMQRFAFLEGRWRYQSSFASSQEPDARWVTTAPQETRFEPRYDGAFLIGTMDTAFPEGSLPWGDIWRTILVVSYDRFQDEYRFGFLDHAWGLFDVYEGRFGDGDTITASNEDSRTWGPIGSGGELGPGAFRIRLGGRDSFTLEWLARQAGCNWTPVMRTTFTRLG